MSDKFDKRTRLMLLAVTMSALCLATIRLGYAPLDVDEAVDWYTASFSIPELVKGTVLSVHGAFYHSILHVWKKFSDSEFWLRAFSALCFTFTVPVVYVIGQTVSGRRAGLYAACLAATAPFLLRYSQEVRPYAMLTLFCSLALMSAALIVSRQSDRPPAVIGQGLRGLWRRWRHGASVSIAWGDDVLWAVYIAAMLGGMLGHNTAVLLLALVTLIFLVAIAAAPFRWRRLRNLIAANIAVLALYAFNISLLLTNHETLVRRGAPAPVDFGMFQKTLLTVYNEHLPDQAIALAALFVLALWGWRRRKDWQWIGFALIGSLGLPLMLAAASPFLSSVFMDRTIIWVSIPFYAVCAAGLARLRSGDLRLIVLAGLLLCNLYGVLKEYERVIPEPWDQVAQTVAQAASSDSAALLCPGWGRTSFSYYWRRHENDMAIFGEQDYQMAALFLEPVAGDIKKWGRRGAPRAMASLFDDYAELWVASRRGDAPQYAYCGLPALQDVFSGYGRLVAERGFGKNLKLFTFARDDAPAAPD